MSEALSQPITIIQRNMAGIIPDCVVEETGIDTLQITEHPVETGAAITDHAFKKPREVTLRWSWSNSGNALHAGQEGFVIQIYNRLLALQASLAPFTLYTGKSPYFNMLLESVTQTTNTDSEFSLTIVALCKEIIVVSTSSTPALGTVSPQASQTQQKNPSSTAPTVSTGQNNLQPLTTKANIAGLENVAPVGNLA